MAPLAVGPAAAARPRRHRLAVHEGLEEGGREGYQDPGSTLNMQYVRGEGSRVDLRQSSIGDRIRQFRQERVPTMTQRELAERAGISVDTISKLEQGVKQTALIGTLHKIAGALDVDVSLMLARPARIDASEDEGGGVVAIRDALTARVLDGEPGNLDELRESTGFAWRAYWQSRYGLLGGLLPELIVQARLAGDPVTLSDVYGVTASMLVALGHPDLAYLAMERALRAAEDSGDQLRRAAVAGWLSWLLMHQTGRGAEEAQRLAIREADAIEPRMRDATPPHAAVWGGLLVSAAVAASRAEKVDEADDLIQLARVAATRLGDDPAAVRMDYHRPFGMPIVLQPAVDIAASSDRPGRALDLARTMPDEAAMPPATRARFLADVAYAQMALGRDADAVETLLKIEREAPSFLRYQPYPRSIVRELIERERRAITPRLRGLATRLGVGDAA
jgi:transcriptional regulator with XRE-family HTH domain